MTRPTSRMTPFAARVPKVTICTTLSGSAAAEADVRLGVESLYSIAATRGHDLEEVFAANQQARELAASYGIPLPVFEPKEAAKKQPEEPTDA